jgi:hypothetical protein
MKQKRIHKTHTFDPVCYEIFKKRCVENNQPVSAMLNSIIKYTIQSKLNYTDKILKSLAS